MPTIKITTEAGTWTTTEDAFKKATWKSEHEVNPRWIARDINSANALKIVEGDECDWTDIETWNLQAKDEQGNPVTLRVTASKILSDGIEEFSAFIVDGHYVDWLQGGFADICVCDTNSRLSVADIEWLVGVSCEALPPIDYSELVDNWLLDNTTTNTRYFIDNCRGFANEWTLYISLSGQSELDNAEAVNIKTARERILTAICPEDEPKNISAIVIY